MKNKKDKISKERLLELIREAKARQERKEQLDKSIDTELNHEKEKFLFG